MQRQRTVSTVQDIPAQALVLTVNGVAALLACSPRTVYRLTDQRRIPRPIRIGGMVRWPRESFERWITDGCPAPDARPRPRNSS